MRHLSLIALCLALTGTTAHAQGACPWAGGKYAFSEHGIYGDFTVDAACSQIVWNRMSDGPETVALERTGDGWKGSLEKAQVLLLDNGANLRVTDYGGPTRQFNATKSN